MAGILVRRGPFLTSPENVFRNTDECCKRTVVQCVRERVARVEVEIFAGGLAHLHHAAVINGISGEVIAADQTRGVPRNAAVIVLAGRIARWSRYDGGRRRTGIRRTCYSLDRAKVAQRGAQLVVRRDEEVSDANGKPVPDLPINLEAGLFRIRDGAMALRIRITNRSRSS